MATKRTVGRGATRNQAQVKARIRKLLRSEFGKVGIATRQPKPATHSFVYDIDEFRALAIDITVAPMSKMAPVMQLIVKPGKNP